MFSWFLPKYREIATKKIFCLPPQPYRPHNFRLLSCCLFRRLTRRYEFPCHRFCFLVSSELKSYVSLCDAVGDCAGTGCGVGRWGRRVLHHVVQLVLHGWNWPIQRFPDRRSHHSTDRRGLVPFTAVWECQPPNLVHSPLHVRHGPSCVKKSLGLPLLPPPVCCVKPSLQPLDPGQSPRMTHHIPRDNPRERIPETAEPNRTCGLPLESKASQRAVSVRGGGARACRVGRIMSPRICHEHMIHMITFFCTLNRESLASQFSTSAVRTGRCIYAGPLARGLCLCTAD